MLVYSCAGWRRRGGAEREQELISVLGSRCEYLESAVDGRGGGREKLNNQYFMCFIGLRTTVLGTSKLRWEENGKCGLCLMFSQGI